ncbi:MAG: efflux RND transporter periplasmic adaptor subunit [Ignavibacteriaceae bacterium]|nr:efflux RND transporter periplasmic adaptor subunit [Ignavibacteriaceae bacterium]
MKNLIKIVCCSLAAIIILLINLSLQSCTDTDGKQVSEAMAKKVTISSDGQIITFPKNSPGLDEFKVSPAEKGSATLSVIAPARVVAGISHSKSAGYGIVLFDSPDVTSLYSQYKQSKANVDLTSKNLVRVKQMYENLGVTGKELNQAETDAATAKASLEEMEGRLKVLGYNPSELESAKGNMVWLMADVPEAQLHEIAKGGNIRITLAAFPDKIFTGRIDAIGSIIDPNTREVKVRISLSNSDGKFLPGMFAQADFGSKISEAYVLPLSAVVTVEGSSYLFIQTASNTFERRKVILASSDESKLVILSGIKDNEKVVTSGAMLLKGISFGY